VSRRIRRLDALASPGQVRSKAILRSFASAPRVFGHHPSPSGCKTRHVARVARAG